jgi:hypothetical protein
VNERATPGPFTAVFVALENGRVRAFIEELPDTVAEGATMETAEAGLGVELARTLAANRWMTQHGFAGARVIGRKDITIHLPRTPEMPRRPPTGDSRR